MTGELTRRLLRLRIGTFALALCRSSARDYVLHIAIQILIWGFIYTAWSLMGRFGLDLVRSRRVSRHRRLRPGPCCGIIAGVTPWLGIPVGHGAGGAAWRC